MARDLQASRLSPIYRRRLRVGWQVLVAWCLQYRLQLEVLASQPVRLNKHLVDFIQHLYDRQVARWVPTHAVLALQHRHRHLRGQLGDAWDSLQSWQLDSVLSSRVPMPRLILDALALVGLIFASHLEPKRAALWVAFSVLVRVGWAAFLRPGELLALTVGDCRIPEQGVEGSRFAVVRLKRPKNRFFMGRTQIALVRCEVATRWLAWAIEGRPADDPVWPASNEVFSRMLKRALSFLQLSNLGLSPGSLRPGGCTAAYEGGGLRSQPCGSRDAGHQRGQCRYIFRRRKQR